MTTDADADKLAQLRFDALRNALYHTARRRVLEGWRRLADFAVIVLGTATAADAGRLIDGAGAGHATIAIGTLAIGGLTAVCGAAQLVFDFAGRARTHEQLQREYYRLLAEIEREAEPPAGAIGRWRSEMVRLAGEEPPVMKALDAVAYNDAADAIYDHAEDHLVITRWQYLTRHLLAHYGVRFPRRGESTVAG